MKKQFYPRHINAGLFRQFHFLPFFIGAAIVVLLFLRFLFPTFFFAVAAPLWKAGDAITKTTDQLFSGFKTKQTLIEELTQAQQERNELLQENKTLAAKMSDIQKVVQGAEEKNITLVAGVIARAPLSPYETLTIQLEQTSTPVANALVVGPGGVPLGTIAEAHDSIAQVRLFSEKGRITEGWIGDSKLPATLIGSGTGSFETTLPIAAAVAVNDAVYLPGPGALFIGSIARINRDETTQKLHVFIRSVVNPFSITWVGITTHSFAS